MNVVMYLASSHAADRLATRLFKDGFVIAPVLNSGKYGAQLNASYLLAFRVDPPKELANKKLEEIHSHLQKMMVELDIAYFGGHITNNGSTTYFNGHLPKLPPKKLKPRNPLDNVVPFPKAPQPETP